jgi:DNA-binding MarR family transcriptional regulator
MRKLDDKVNHLQEKKESNPLELIHAVMHQYRAQQYQVLRDGAHEITHMESKILRYVDRHPDVAQNDLVQGTGRDKAQIARLVKNLRELGLLATGVDEKDRRSVRLNLTEVGEVVLRELEKQGKKLSAKAVAGLSGEEKHQLVALLRHLQANLSS